MHEGEFQIHHYPDGSIVMSSPRAGHFMAMRPNESLLRDDEGDITHHKTKEEAEGALGVYGHGPRGNHALRDILRKMVHFNESDWLDGDENADEDTEADSPPEPQHTENAARKEAVP